MPWEVEFTDEFNQWWHTLTMPEQRALGSRIGRPQGLWRRAVEKIFKTSSCQERVRDARIKGAKRRASVARSLCI